MKIQQQNLRYVFRYEFNLLSMACTGRDCQFENINNGYFDRFNDVEFHKLNGRGQIDIVGFPRLYVPYSDYLDQLTPIQGYCREFVPQIIKALNLANGLPIDTLPIVDFPHPYCVTLMNRWDLNE